MVTTPPPEKIDIVRKVLDILSSKGSRTVEQIKFDSRYSQIGFNEYAIRSSVFDFKGYLIKCKSLKTISKSEIKNAKKAGKLCQLLIKKILNESPADDVVKSLFERI